MLGSTPETRRLSYERTSTRLLRTWLAEYREGILGGTDSRWINWHTERAREIEEVLRSRLGSPN